MVIGRPKLDNNSSSCEPHGIAGMCWRIKDKIQPPLSFKVHVCPESKFDNYNFP